VPIVAKVGLSAFVAVVVAALVMALRRNEFLAAALGLVAVALVRAFGL